MQRNITLPTCQRRLGLAVMLLTLLASIAGGALALNDDFGAASPRQPVLAAETLVGSSDSGMVPGCRALTCALTDWDGDGVCTIYDFYEFAADWAIGDPSTDLSCDATIDSDDYFLFLDLFAACC